MHASRFCQANFVDLRAALQTAICNKSADIVRHILAQHLTVSSKLVSMLDFVQLYRHGHHTTRLFSTNTQLLADLHEATLRGGTVTTPDPHLTP